MFSQASVSIHTVCAVGGGHIWYQVPLERVCPGVGTHPLLLTPSIGHYTYGWQAGVTHPTGMLSCFPNRWVQLVSSWKQEMWKSLSGYLVLLLLQCNEYLMKIDSCLISTLWCSVNNFFARMRNWIFINISRFQIGNVLSLHQKKRSLLVQEVLGSLN